MFGRIAIPFAIGSAFAVLAGGSVGFAANDSGSADTSERAARYASAQAKTKSFDASGVSLDLDDDGLDDVLAAYARCPRGTQMTGGGIFDYTSTGYLIGSYPDTEGTEAWLAVVGIAEDTYESPDDLVASVTCWSPTGTPPGGYRQSTDTPQTQLPARIVDLLQERVTLRP